MTDVEHANESNATSRSGTCGCGNILDDDADTLCLDCMVARYGKLAPAVAGTARLAAKLDRFLKRYERV